MNLTLRKDLVLVESLTLDSPIIRLEKSGTQLGRVVKTGSDDVAEGETVAFDEHTGEKVNLWGKNLLVMKLQDVLAVV